MRIQKVQQSVIRQLKFNSIQVKLRDFLSLTGKISQVSRQKIGAEKSEIIDFDVGDTEANRSKSSTKCANNKDHLW